MKKITLLFALLITSIGFSQTYDLLESFNGSGLEDGFGGTSAEYTTDPAGSDQVIQITSSATGEIWQGINVALTSNYKLTSATQLTMQLDVYSTTAIIIAPKAQGGIAGSPDSVTSVDHPGTGWATLTFTFDQSLDGKAPANGEYADFALHINWDTSANTFGAADSRMFYIKNLKGLAVEPVVSFVPTVAPSPTNSDSTILSIYNDSGSFNGSSVIWTQDYAFGTNQGEVDTDASESIVNNALKMDFSVAGWGAGTDAPVDITAQSHLHFDYYAPAGDAGANGHEFKFILIGEGQGEKEYVFKASGGNAVLTFDQWVSVDIPLSFYEGLGLTKDKFLQYKLGSTSDLNTKVVFFDNIYFYNSATASVSDNKLLDVTMYPNPASDRLNISATNTIKNASIFNVLGKKVMSLSINKNSRSIDVSNLASGIYLIKYQLDSNAIGTAKFIKE